MLPIIIPEVANAFQLNCMEKNDNKPGLHIRAPESTSEWAAYFDLRWRILRAPWNQPPDSARDEQEEEALHLAAFAQSGEIIACGRAQFNDPETAQFRYMAVAEKARGRGVGRALLLELERLVAKQGARRVVLNARDVAKDFYLKNGYENIGEGPTIFGEITHTVMSKSLV